MGAGDSKDFNKEMRVFPPEEREILSANFDKMSLGKNKVDRSAVEVGFHCKYLIFHKCEHVCFIYDTLT